MSHAPPDLVSIDVSEGMWERFYRVAPLVVIGTKEDGEIDLAPKHMAFPLGWEGYNGFVCSPRHATYRNIGHTREFTVSYPRPTQVVLASLAAAPREGWESNKPIVSALPTFPATRVRAPLLADADFFLECELERIVDGFGPNSLIAGRVVAAHARPEALIVSDRDPAEHLANSPLLAYVDPGRFTAITDSDAFPFPAGFKK